MKSYNPLTDGPVDRSSSARAGDAIEPVRPPGTDQPWFDSSYTPPESDVRCNYVKPRPSTEIPINMPTLERPRDVVNAVMQGDVITNHRELEDYFDLLKQMYYRDKTMTQLIMGLITLQLNKGHDYSGDEDIFANLRSCRSLGVAPWVGVMIRISDKVSRLSSFAKAGILKVKDESVMDTFMDLANYALLGLRMFKEEKNDVC